ncbi:MAG: MmcQ/YjbR family DNA-binding protein [Acidobacteriales bacterium]|nr:MmcQ/YjbR family DNA-binding protein [Terriglobales bacterium]
MNIEAIREFCLSLPGATEQLQWEESLLFKVNGKMFVILNLNVARERRLSFRCSPDTYAELIEREGINPARYNLWKYNWVSLDGLNVIPAPELKELMRESHAIITEKSSKPRKRAQKKSTGQAVKAAKRSEA